MKKETEKRKGYIDRSETFDEFLAKTEPHVSRKAKKPNLSGSTFDSLLKEDGFLEEVEAVAMKRIIAWQIAEIMRAKRISKKTMAARMHTSRSQLDRLLDPDNATVHLATITQAAKVVGKKIRLELVECGVRGVDIASRRTDPRFR
jgi:antitoxin HicB